MGQEVSTYHRCFPPVFHMYGTEEKHGLCGNFLGKESCVGPPYIRIVISWHDIVISWHDIIISWHDTIISCCVWFEARG